MIVNDHRYKESKSLINRTLPSNDSSNRCTMRPINLSEFVGQKRLKKLINTAALSAIKRNASFPHTLVMGTAGLGKTSLARLIANERGVLFIQTTAEALENPEAVQGLLCKLDTSGLDKTGNPTCTIKPSILFVDEAHRLPRESQELLYSAIEDRVLDIRVKDFITGLMKPSRMVIPPFTLVAATNRPADLTNSFRDRLRLHLRIEPYSINDSTRIAENALGKMGIQVSSKAASCIAKRGRGVPRRIIGLCEQIRDVVLAAGKSVATVELCDEAFNNFGIDSIGLTVQDYELLECLNKFKTPVGLKTIAALINESAEVIEEMLEPYLLKENLISRTPRGRIITEAGKKHLIKSKC